MTEQESPESINDVVLFDSAGDKNIIDEIKGKVTLFANVTGHCGNAEQFKILEDVYQKYKDRGFEVVAVPTNDYCGPGITYGKYEGGIASAKDAEDYGRSEWGATYRFSELVVSRESRDDEEQKLAVHSLYKKLNPGGEAAAINGNFEKFIVDKKGVKRIRKANGVLLWWAHRDGYCESPEQEYKNLCADIEQLLEEE
jgi:glutathione peroxidase